MERLTDALNGFGPAYIRHLRAAFLRRLGVKSLGEAADQRLLDTTLALLREKGEAIRWEPLFFDWFGGFASSARTLGGPRAKAWQGDAFDAFRSTRPTTGARSRPRSRRSGRRAKPWINDC